MKRIIPNLRGKSIEEAKEILDKEKIKYEDKEKEVLSFVKKGNVVKTKPGANKEIDSTEKVKIYTSQGSFFIFLALAVFIVGAFSYTLSTGVFRSIVGQTIITGKMRAPKVDISKYKDKDGNPIWNKDTIIQVENPSGRKYEYCIKDNKDDKCKWEVTDTNNIVVAENGHKIVVIREIDDEGNPGPSTEVEVFIDNNNPVVINVDVEKLTDGIKATVNAVDNESGIDKYYYSVDGNNWVEDGNTHIFDRNDLEKIYVKVTDKMGNEIVVVIPIPQDTNTNPINPDNPNENTDPADPNGSNNPGGITDNWDIPQINLSEVPTIITYGDNYELPSYVDFGNDTGAYGCLVDGKSATDTSSIKVGSHFIECTAISDHGKQAMVEKNIVVNPLKGDDEVFDGWIRLNLTYPSESVNRQWRINRPNEVRTYNDDWQDYVGPILVKLSDIENVYIRYDLGGKTYIVPPNSEVLVSIEAEKWILGDNETTKINIYYDQNATLRQYRINGGAWQDYTGEFEVPAITRVDARVEKQEKLYDSNGDYVSTKTYSNADSIYIAHYRNVTTPGNPEPIDEGNPIPPRGKVIIETPPISPDMVLDGPIISSNPSTGKVESTTVTITTAEPGTIYYREDDGLYKKYTGSFRVTKNEIIRAYYYRDSDGKKSETTVYRVKNIKQPQLPYVVIIASPDSYLTKDVDKVTVSIVASDYDPGTLVYSTDGIIYRPYTEPFEVVESTKIYAKATNQYGDATDVLSITTKTPPKKMGKLDVFIIANPSKEEVQGLINSTEITISYDNRAANKYYSFDGVNWRDYTGPFTMTSNGIVYAYASNDNAIGSDELGIDYLTTGIMKPIIKPNTNAAAYQVRINITFDDNSTIKKYKIDNGDWKEYTGPFYVYENCTIYAYNENALGYKAQNTKVIGNIVPRQDMNILDEGMYYLIRLNYPTTSKPRDREYKYKENGTWKVYNEQGIYLIKPEYKDEILSSGNNIAVKDREGNVIVLTDHYYFLDEDINNALIDIFMRWGEETLTRPRITLNTTDPAQKVKVNIQYTEEAVKKEYKLIYSDGTSTDWINYKGEFTIDQNGTTIYARGTNVENLHSEMASLRVNNIDKTNPTIEIRGDFTTNKYSINVMVSAKDNMMIETVKYAKGSHNIAYFSDINDTIPNNSTVKIEENGVYTFYVKDQAGNETVKEINVTNIDKDMPNISIDILTNKLSSIVKLSINYNDAVTKEYKIGKNTSTYTTYPSSNEITLTSYDHYQLANSDGSITVCARGVKSNNVEGIVCEDIYVLDTDMFNAPVINSTITYPLLTSNGFIGEGLLTITYDDRDDIVNEFCLVGCNNQDNWTRYTLPMSYTVGTVKARSKKLNSGLTLETSKNINYNDDSISYNTIDNDASTFMQIPANTTKVFEVNTRDTLTIRVQSDAQGAATIKSYKDTKLLSNDDIDSTTKDIMILPGTTRVEITTGNSALILYEIVLTGRKTSFVGDSILSILEDNDLTTGNYYFIANDILYPVHLYAYDGDQIWDSTTIPMPNGFGNTGDVGTASDYAQNMVIVKVNGDLTNNTTIKPFSNEYGGPKGFMVYVTGKLTNNGTIDNSYGGYAKGENVYLWKNADGTYEYIPAEGAAGGASVKGNAKPGNVGANGSTAGKRATGGGGSGASHGTTAGAGGRGTSYSGGPGGGAAYSGNAGVDGSNYGGAGGNGLYAGGSGNPGGILPNGVKGNNGTGGLLIIYSDEFENTGTISAVGKDGKPAFTGGGASGGGSINIFTNQTPGINGLGTVINTKYASMLGTTSVAGGIGYTTNGNTVVTTSGGPNGYIGGASGAGTVNIGEIRNGQYYDLKEIIQQDIDAFTESVTKRGDSILSILDGINLPEGEYYYFFVANGEEYPVHLYVFDGDQEWSGNKVFGNAGDCATGTSNDKLAQNMVIVKVNGNLTNNGTIRPYYNTTYGGPKGFTLYVTGTLTNNGTIDNSHGALAQGQNVYLWKNSDGTYEYVPATGANGGAAFTRNDYNKGVKADGNSGQAGSNRSTGGGGSGSLILNNGLSSSGSSTVGAGSKGTSYSGGSGGGASYGYSYGSGCTAENATGNGGIGGRGCTNGGALGTGSGGAGNPGATQNGGSGTGGLLVIYADGYVNNGTVQANGLAGGTNNAGGGASGGGSINIFTNQPTDIDGLSVVTNSRFTDILGNVIARGGSNDPTTVTTLGGAGGAGSVSIGEIKNGQYYDLSVIIQQDMAAYKETITYRRDSILEAVNDMDMSEGEYYRYIVVNGEEYSVHLYVFDGNQEWSENKVFGDAVDVASGTDTSKMAKNMVVVKVNGDLTNNATIRPYYNATYGGPKGFMVYVTGTLTNNGTIDNSHGALAQGQNVYLWKNSDDTYEYVPAQGEAGGAGFTRNDYNKGMTVPGNAGTAGTNRSTGGGGSGSLILNNGLGSSGSSTAGAGSKGTSYSGGSGGGASYGYSYGSGCTAENATGNGGIGGKGCTNGGALGTGPGGAGNPGATQNGASGTGGLLIIYANTVAANNSMTAKGSVGGTATTGAGSSGGGSINIFYTNSCTGCTNANVAGGAAATGTNANAKGGAGGSGSVTQTQITMPTRSKGKSIQSIKPVLAPEITLDTLDLVSTKLVTITYQEGFKGEYSLDLGKTWLEYKEGIYVEENTTILARTIDSEGKIVRTSSFTITTIKKEEVVTTPPIDKKDEKDETDDENGNETIKPDGGDDDE